MLRYITCIVVLMLTNQFVTSRFKTKHKSNNVGLGHIKLPYFTFYRRSNFDFAQIQKCLNFVSL